RAAVVDPARDAAVHVAVDDVLVVEGEQERVAVLVEFAVFGIDLVMAAEPALVADDALFLLDHRGGEHAVAVDLRLTGLDLLVLLAGLVLALGHLRHRLAGERRIVVEAPAIFHRARQPLQGRGSNSCTKERSPGRGLDAARSNGTISVLFNG